MLELDEKCTDRIVFLASIGGEVESLAKLLRRFAFRQHEGYRQIAELRANRFHDALGARGIAGTQDQDNALLLLAEDHRSAQHYGEREQDRESAPPGQSGVTSSKSELK